MDRAYRHRRSAVPWKIGFPCRQGGSLDKRALLAVAYGRRLEQSAFVRKRALSGVCGALGMALTTSASAVASGCSGRSRRIVTFRWPCEGRRPNSEVGNDGVREVRRGFVVRFGIAIVSFGLPMFIRWIGHVRQHQLCSDIIFRVPEKGLKCGWVGDDAANYYAKGVLPPVHSPCKGRSNSVRNGCVPWRAMQP